MPRRLLTCLLVSAALPAVALAALPDLVVRAGAVEANLHQDDLDSESRLGVAAGLGADLPLIEGFHLAPEVWYQQRGFEKANFAGVSPLELRTEVLSVPVLVAYHFAARSVDPRAFVGLAADVLLGAEARRDADWVDVSDDPGSESLSWSVVLGGGVRWHDLDLDVRYVHGLSAATTLDYDLFDDTLSQMQAYEDATETTWVFTLGYWF
ncbi:outer membrane beta-barrel protein [bacterium]|nr:outer membrane beta-barrel protein [bacterium]